MARKRGGCLKVLLYIIIGIVLLSIFVSALPDEAPEGATITATSTAPAITQSGLSYYSQLNRTETEIYDAIFRDVSSGKTKCTVENINYTENKAYFNRAIQAFNYDHPEYFWLNGGAMMSGTNNKVTVTLSCYEYWSYTMDPQKYSDVLQSKVAEVVEMANKFTSDYEKALFVHDYIVTTTEYDYDGLAESEKTFHDANSEYIYSAYGCLVNGKAVCSGYAKAYQLILCNLGIECTYVTGYGGSEPHGWNCVKLDGDTYYVDVTWDDAKFSNKSTVEHPNEPEYKYFCITTEELRQTHTIDESVLSAPICTSDKYSYYVHNGYFFPYYDFEQVKTAVTAQAQANKKVIAVRFANGAVLSEAKADLFDNNSWSKIDALPSDSVFYNIDTDKSIITFFVN